MTHHHPRSADVMKTVLESRLEMLYRNSKRRKNAVWVSIIISILLIILSTIVFIFWDNPYYPWFTAILWIIILIAASRYPSYATYGKLINDIEVDIEMLSISRLPHGEQGVRNIRSRKIESMRIYDHSVRHSSSKLIASIMCIVFGFFFIAAIFYINE